MMSDFACRLVARVVCFYKRRLSPALPSRCRYSPTCSEYMLVALENYGMRGVLMGLWRLMRCNPWARGGHDPVPSEERGNEI
jgi:hypothetical protein